MLIGIRQGGAPTHTARIKHCPPCALPSCLRRCSLLCSPPFRKFSGHHIEMLDEVVGDSRLYLNLLLVGGTVPCSGLCRPVCCCCRRLRGAWSRLCPGVGSAVLLVLVRANLGSKGESLGLLAQAAFAIGFLDTSWDFNCCEVQKQN